MQMFSQIRLKEAKEGRDMHIYVSHEGCAMVPTTYPCYRDMESDSTLRSVLKFHHSPTTFDVPIYHILL